MNPIVFISSTVITTINIPLSTTVIVVNILEYKLDTRAFYFFGGMDLRQEAVISNTYLLYKAGLKLPDAEVRQLC